MVIDAEEARRIARLARLELDPHNVEPLIRELGSILDYVAELDELRDAEESGAMASANHRAMRDDAPRTGLTVEQALLNAPDAAADHFRVPRSFGETE